MPHVLFSYLSHFQLLTLPILSGCAYASVSVWVRVCVVHTKVYTGVCVCVCVLGCHVTKTVYLMMGNYLPYKWVDCGSSWFIALPGVCIIPNVLCFSYFSSSVWQPYVHIVASKCIHHLYFICDRLIYSFIFKFGYSYALIWGSWRLINSRQTQKNGDRKMLSWNTLNTIYFFVSYDNMHFSWR